MCEGNHLNASFTVHFCCLIQISDPAGKTQHQFSVRDTPSMLQFSEIKSNAAKNEMGDNVVSIMYFFTEYLLCFCF